MEKLQVSNYSDSFSCFLGDLVCAVCLSDALNIGTSYFRKNLEEPEQKDKRIVFEIFGFDFFVVK